MKFKFFISSVQDEFATERRELKKWLTEDPFVSRFVERVFLFEDVAAQGRPPSGVYLDEVKSSDVYIGILGAQYYGKRSAKKGVSATEQEFNAARDADLECWAYVADEPKRDKREEKFIARVGRSATWSAFKGFPELRDAVFASVVDFLDKKKLLMASDFDTAICAEASLADVSRTRVAWYIEELLAHGKKSLPIGTSPRKLLTHLGMVKGNRITNGGLLLFGANPQSVYYQAMLKCVWVAGTVYTRPFLDTAKYEGDLFALREQGRNFVMSRIAQSRGIRDRRPDAPSAFEIPYEAVEEAIVNALVHRNWHSSASIEIRLFADRLEVWSPGRLPPDITIPELYADHDSHPVNKEILKTFDKINVVESLGTGTGRMIDTCRAAGLPAPVFEQRGSAFVVTILKDLWTAERLDAMNLNPDQIKAVAYVKLHGWISTGRYVELYDVPRRTSVRELDEIVKAGVFVRVGGGNRARYELKSVCAKFEEKRIPIRFDENGKAHLVNDERPVNKVRKCQVSNTCKCDTPQNTPQKPDQKSDQKPDQKSDQKSVRPDQKPDQKSNDAIPECLQDEPSSVKSVYEAIRKNNRVTYRGMAAMLGLNKDTVNVAVGLLVRRGLLRRIGEKKNGHWEVLQ